MCREGVAADDDGLWLEFGTGTGASASIISSYRENGLLFTFDSFQGLPSDWRVCPDGTKYGKGSLTFKKPTALPSNVKCIEGLFSETLPSFLESNSTKKVSLLHIDCDVYSSTQEVLSLLQDRIVADTVIVLDECFFYDCCADHEAKALYELLTEKGLSYEWLGIHGTKNAYDILAELSDDEIIGDATNRMVPFDRPCSERVALRIV